MSLLCESQAPVSGARVAASPGTRNRALALWIPWIYACERWCVVVVAVHVVMAAKYEVDLDGGGEGGEGEDEGEGAGRVRGGR